MNAWIREVKHCQPRHTKQSIEKIEREKERERVSSLTHIHKNNNYGAIFRIWQIVYSGKIKQIGCLKVFGSIDTLHGWRDICKNKAQKEREREKQSKSDENSVI